MEAASSARPVSAPVLRTLPGHAASLFRGMVSVLVVVAVMIVFLSLVGGGW